MCMCMRCRGVVVNHLPDCVKGLFYAHVGHRALAVVLEYLNERK